MARRYVGDAFVDIMYRPKKGDYEGYVKVGKHSWAFDQIYPPKHIPYGGGPESPSAFDLIAKAAVSFGAFYNSLHQGTVPKFAPDVKTADAIYQATARAIDDRGRYAVRRSLQGEVRWK